MPTPTSVTTVRQRAPGTVGHKITAITNAFTLKWSDKRIFHYYEMKLNFSLKSSAKHSSSAPPSSGDDAAIPKSKRTQLIMRLQNEVRPDIFGQAPGAFDGQYSLYSVKAYDFPTDPTAHSFEVPWGSRNGKVPRVVTITLTRVNDVDWTCVKKLIQGDKNSEKDAALTLNMLNIFVQAQPRMQAGTLYNARSFYVKDSRNMRENRDIYPFELWRGYYQTVRPTYLGLVVNIDYTVGVVQVLLPSLPVMDIFMGYIKKPDARSLSHISKDDPQYRALRLFARSIKFTIEIPGRTNTATRARAIADLVLDCGAYTFEKNGEQVTVAEHFHNVHNFMIPPRTLGIKTKSGEVFPITVCKTVAQLYKGKNSSEVVSKAMMVMPKTPQERLNRITDSWGYLNYSGSPFVAGAGLEVNSQPLTIKGRILPVPKVTFGCREIPHNSPGVWNVMDRKFINPAKIERWTVVCFEDERKAPTNVVQEFVKDLTSEMRQRGVGASHKFSRHNPHADIKRILMEEGSAANAQLILVLLPESAEELRNAVKTFGDIEIGVQTQCVKWSRDRPRDVMSRDKRRINQYCNNLILKINMRMGGINFKPTEAWFRDRPTMVLGADVSHPGPGSTYPSVAALVCSVDEGFTRYIASTTVQPPRVEMIEDLAYMFENALKQYISFCGRKPGRLLFYRDGVSEGEFSTVLQRELSQMAVVLKKDEYYGSDTKKWPSLNFIVVGKRHHIRFFPRPGEPGCERGNGNMPPGFVVDTDIVHPTNADFYLQSQPGLKGTSRPSHYTVLKMNGLTIDQFHLCHCYLRATRAVKIPAPLVCARAKFHFKDDASISGGSGGSDSFDLAMWKRNFSPIHPKLANSMYWV
ncbi:Piwi domain containing protein [Amanita muscaria]